MKEKTRCPWALGHPLLIVYHDEEWGVPIHDDQHWFEKLLLDGAQAGLSWLTILKKREAYREAFAEFDPKRVAKFTARDEARLMKNAGIVRNKQKIASAVENARAFLDVQKEFGSFDAYIWAFVDGKPQQPKRRKEQGWPARTELSDLVAKDLKKRGFSFVGTTIVYAFLQASGVVNDHMVTCHCHKALSAPRRPLSSRAPAPGRSRAARPERPRRAASTTRAAHP